MNYPSLEQFIVLLTSDVNRARQGGGSIPISGREVYARDVF